MSNYDSNPTNVRAVQTAINASGYTPALSVDGVYGPLTAKGVVWFEQLHGLAVDSGVIGDQVMAATIAPIPAPVDADATSGGAVQGQTQAPLVPPVKTIILRLRPSAAAMTTTTAGGTAVANSVWPAILTGLGIGALTGSGLGVAVVALKFPIGTMVGAALGALTGLLVSKANTPGATFAGDVSFGDEIDLGEFALGDLDDLDNYSITAAEIGVPTLSRSLRG